MEITRRRWFLIGMCLLTIIALGASAVLAFWVDRQQCRSAATAIHNSRVMWEYILEQNPGPEADKFLEEMNRRIPPAECRGGTLHVQKAET